MDNNNYIYLPQNSSRKRGFINTFSSNPIAQRYITERNRSLFNEAQLQNTQTPLGALSSGIALYMQRKRENQAIEELNKQIQAQEKDRNERRESLIGALPEANRVIAGALTDEKDLVKYASDVLTPPSTEDSLIIENKRLQNQKLKKEINQPNPTSYYQDDTKSLRPLPVQAVKLQNEALDIIGTANGINADLNQLEQQLETNKLKLGPVTNLKSQALNAIGSSSPESRNFASFKATLEKQRNDSLRLNKGVQTEGDAQRAWNELFNNLSDQEVVKQRLKEIQKINKRASDLQKLQVDQIRSNYGVAPFDFTQFENRPTALGSNDQSNPNIQSMVSEQGVKYTIKR